MLSAIETLAAAGSARPPSEAKLRALRIVDEELGASLWRAAPEFPRLLSFAVVALLQTLNDEDMNIWSLAKEVLNKNIKALLKTYHERIIFELFRGIRMGVGVAAAVPGASGNSSEFEESSISGAPPAPVLGGRAQRIALELFAAVCHRIKPHKARKFMISLVSVIQAILKPLEVNAKEEDVLLLEALGTHFEPIARHLVPFLSDSEVKLLLGLLINRLSLSQAASRRAMANAIASVARHYPLRSAVLAYIFDVLKNLPMLEKDENLLQGVLQCYILLVKVVAEMRRENRYATDPYIPELHKAISLCRWCLRISGEVEVRALNSNVLVSALEWLNEMLSLYPDEVFRLVLVSADQQEAFLREMHALLSESSLRVSIRALVLACSAGILKSRRTQTPLWSLFVRAWSRAGVWNIRLLLDDTDPTLRGYAASFQAAFLESYCSAPRHHINLPNTDMEDLVAKSDSWFNQFISELLNVAIEDKSSISAKMAVSGLISAWEPMASSRWALWALFILIRLVDLMTPRAFRLVKTEIVDFLTSRDWSLVHFLVASALAPDSYSSSLAECSPLRSCSRSTLESLQSRAFNSLWNLLYDSDPQVRSAVSDGLARFVDSVDYRLCSPIRIHSRSMFGIAPWFTSPNPLILDNHQLLRLRLSLFSSDLGDSDNQDKIDGGIFRDDDSVSGTASVYSLAFERSYVPVAGREDSGLHWLLEKIALELERASMTDDSQCSTMLKSLYRFLRGLASRANVLPLHQLVPMLLDQLEALPAALDVHVHLDLLQLLRTLMPQLSGDLAKHARRVWLHLVRVVHIIAAVVRHQPRPALIESPSPPVKDVIETTLGSIQSRAQYLRLWERLADSYRIGRTAFTLEENTFDALLSEAFLALSQCIQQAHTLGAAYVAQWSLELIGYSRVCFEEQPRSVLSCVAALFILTFTPPHHQHVFNQHELVKYGSRHDDLISPLMEKCSETVSSRPSLLNAPRVWGRVFRDLSCSASPAEMGAALSNPHCRGVLKELEPLIAAAMQRYLASHDPHLQQSILRVLAVLVRHEVEFSALDKDQTFFRQILTQVQGQRGAAFAIAPLALLAQLHIEKRYLHAVLSPRAFAPLISQALRGWTRFATTVEFSSSLLGLVQIFWSSSTEVVNSDEERELRQQMRRDFLSQLLHRLPHPLASQVLLFVLEFTLGAHPTLSPAASSDENLRTTTVQTVVDGVLNFLHPLHANPWKICALGARDLIAIFTLIDRLPALPVAIILPLFDIADRASPPSSSSSEFGAPDLCLNIHEISRGVLILRLLNRCFDSMQNPDLELVFQNAVIKHFSTIMDKIEWSVMRNWSHLALLFDSLSVLNERLLQKDNSFQLLIQSMLEAKVVGWFMAIRPYITRVHFGPIFALIRLARRVEGFKSLTLLLKTLLDLSLDDSNSTWLERLALGKCVQALATLSRSNRNSLTPLALLLDNYISLRSERSSFVQAWLALASSFAEVRGLLLYLIHFSKTRVLPLTLRRQALVTIDKCLALGSMDSDRRPEELSAAVIALSLSTPPPGCEDSLEWQEHFGALAKAERCVALQPSLGQAYAKALALARGRSPALSLSFQPIAGDNRSPDENNDVVWLGQLLCRSNGSKVRARSLLQDILRKSLRTNIDELQLSVWRQFDAEGMLDSFHWETLLPVISPDSPLLNDIFTRVSTSVNELIQTSQQKSNIWIEAAVTVVMLNALCRMRNHSKQRWDSAFPSLDSVFSYMNLIADSLATASFPLTVPRRNIKNFLDTLEALLTCLNPGECESLSVDLRRKICASLLSLFISRQVFFSLEAVRLVEASDTPFEGLVALLRSSWFQPDIGNVESKLWINVLRTVSECFNFNIFPDYVDPINLDYQDDPYFLLSQYDAAIPSNLHVLRKDASFPYRTVLQDQVSRICAPLLAVIGADDRADANSGEDVAVPPALRVFALRIFLRLIALTCALESRTNTSISLDPLLAILESLILSYSQRTKPSQLALQHCALFAFAEILRNYPSLTNDNQRLRIATAVQGIVQTLPEFGEDPLIRPLLLRIFSGFMRYPDSPPGVQVMAKLLSGALSTDNDELLHEYSAVEALQELADFPRERADLIRASPSIPAALKTRSADGPRSHTSNQLFTQVMARWLAVSAEILPAAAAASLATSPLPIASTTAPRGNGGPDGDRVLERIEAVKRASERLRAAANSDEVRKIESLFDKLLIGFGEEERISLIFGELTRAQEHSERFVPLISIAGISENLCAEWFKMSFDHLVHLGTIVSSETALRTLAALLFTVSHHPLKTPLVDLLASSFDLEKGLENSLHLPEIERLLSIACGAHLQGQNAEVRRTSLLTSFRRSPIVILRQIANSFDNQEIK